MTSDHSPPSGRRRAIGDRLAVDVPVVALLAVAAALRLWSIDFGLPGRFRPDEGYMVLKAFRVMQGDFDADYYYIYPTFFLYMISLVLLVVQTVGELLGAFGGEAFAAFVSQREAAPLYLIGRLTTVAFSLIGIFAVYLLGRDACGRPVGLLAAFLLALSFSHARDSHFATTDIAAATLATCALWRLLTLARRDRWRDYLLVGGLVGLAVSTKYTAAVLALPCLVAHGMRLAANRTQLSPGMACGRPLAAVASGFVAFAVTSPFALYNTDQVWAHFTYTGGYVFEGETGGVSTAQMYGGWSWLLGFGLRYGAGYVLEALILAGVGYAIYLVWGRHEGGDAALLLLAFAVAVLVPYLSTAVLFFRYMALTMPVFCLLAARAMWAGWEHLPGKTPWRLVGGCVLLLVTVAEPVYRISSFNRLAREVDTRQLAREWIEANVPERDPIIIRRNLRYTRPQLPRSDRYTTFSAYQQARARGLDSTRSAWFIVDRHEIEAFSPAPPPAIRDFLEREATVVRRFSPYVEGRAGDAVFDPADAFYIPVAGFDAMIRPGPELTIYHVALE